jgi:hypothetical protein
MPRRTRWPLGLCAPLLGFMFTAAHAGTPPCGRLCDVAWQLDEAASTDTEDALDDAIDEYKEEKPRRRRAPSGDYAAIAKAELDDSLGPLRQRPMREELREELKRLLVIPTTLRIKQDGSEISLDEGRGNPRHLDLADSYSRVDSLGTAEVKARLAGGAFVITENYRKGRSNKEAYAVEAKGDRLVVTRTLSRPALHTIVIKSVYHPAF